MTSNNDNIYVLKRLKSKFKKNLIHHVSAEKQKIQ